MKSLEVTATAKGLSDEVFSKLAARARNHKGKLYPLHVGDTFREPPACARSENISATKYPGAHKYAPVRGRPDLVEAISERLFQLHDRNVEPSQIQVTCGATSGISLIFQTLLDVGDEVLLPSPFWPLSRGIIESRGGKAIQVPIMHQLEDVDLDVESRLEGFVSRKTKAIYINSPHNPTGAVLDESQLRAFFRIAEKHQLWVVCDEAYQDLYFQEKTTPATWTFKEIQDRYIAVHTLSKSYGLAGARIGYIHAENKEFMSALRGVQTFQTYCAPQPMQILGREALRFGQGWTEESCQIYQENARMVAEHFQLSVPAGGTFLMLDIGSFLAPEETSFSFLVRSLEEAGVLFTPGSACGRDFQQWVRICISSLPNHEMKSALSALTRAGISG